MKYQTLDWGEQRELFNEGCKEGINFFHSSLDLVAAGLSDEEIAEELGYDLPRVQHFINKVRVRYASLCSSAKIKSPADGQKDQAPSAAKPADCQPATST